MPAVWRSLLLIVLLTTATPLFVPGAGPTTAASAAPVARERTITVVNRTRLTTSVFTCAGGCDYRITFGVTPPAVGGPPG